MLPERTATVGRSIVETRARQGAGRPVAGAAGVSLGAAAEFLRRQKALAAERAATRDKATDPAPLPVVVDRGVTPRV